MAYEDQVSYEDDIPYFTAHVLYVDAENPADGTIRMPGPYYIEAWTCVSASTDPPVLVQPCGGPYEGRNGFGAIFKIPCAPTGDYVIFATRRSTFEGDPWEAQTSSCMGGSRNLQPNSYVVGFIKFLLRTA
jgi:hypothetical protein